LKGVNMSSLPFYPVRSMTAPEVLLAGRRRQLRDKKCRPNQVMGGRPTALAVFLKRPQAEDQIGANEDEYRRAPPDPQTRNARAVDKFF
jgi:hypothetical protein